MGRKEMSVKIVKGWGPHPWFEMLRNGGLISSLIKQDSVTDRIKPTPPLYPPLCAPLQTNSQRKKSIICPPAAGLSLSLHSAIRFLKEIKPQIKLDFWLCYSVFPWHGEMDSHINVHHTKLGLAEHTNMVVWADCGLIPGTHFLETNMTHFTEGVIYESWEQ